MLISVISLCALTTEDDDHPPPPSRSPSLLGLVPGWCYISPHRPHRAPAAAVERGRKKGVKRFHDDDDDDDDHHHHHYQGSPSPAPQSSPLSSCCGRRWVRPSTRRWLARYPPRWLFAAVVQQGIIIDQQRTTTTTPTNTINTTARLRV